MNLFKRIRLLQTVRNVIIQSAAVVAPPGLKLCNPYFFISETNGRNASMNNSLIRVFNVKREITLFNLPQLRYTTYVFCFFCIVILHCTLVYWHSLKIYHCLVFISIKLSYLSVSYLSSIIIPFSFIVMPENVNI